MAIRKYKPTTPGRRQSSVSEFNEITRSTPEKSLLRPLSKTGGRNVHGHITTRHIGGGHKRRYRVIDFRRNDKDGITAKVAHIEYDPNRTANIALLHYADGEKRYILAPRGLTQGTVVESGPAADIKSGNNLPLRTSDWYHHPQRGAKSPGGGAKLARSAGASIQLLGKEGKYAIPRDAVHRDPFASTIPPPRDRRSGSATSTRSTSAGARPAVCAGRASARPSAVSS